MEVLLSDDETESEFVTKVVKQALLEGEGRIIIQPGLRKRNQWTDSQCRDCSRGN